MRIISGKYKGKILKGFDIDGTRPTMDRVKESLIGSIQLKLPDAIVLDLFTGSGSVGLEMVSNGAKSAYLVDKNPLVIKVLKSNVELLKPTEKIELINRDFKDALKEFKNKNIKFDIIFLDPPYKMNLTDASISLIKEYDLINEDGLIICEKENEKFGTHGYSVYKEKKYGSKKIIILRNNN